MVRVFLTSANQLNAHLVIFLVVIFMEDSSVTNEQNFTKGSNQGRGRGEGQWGGGGAGGGGQGGQHRLPPPEPCTPASRTFISLFPPLSVLLPSRIAPGHLAGNP